MKNRIVILIAVLLLSSCTKDELPVGDYTGRFNGMYTRDSTIHNYSMEYIIQISESNKTSIIVQYENYVSELSKDNHRISGTLDFIEIGGSGSEGHIWGPIDVNGTWKNKNGSYTISGNFSRIYKIVSAPDSTVSEFPIRGTFEIKSDS